MNYDWLFSFAVFADHLSFTRAAGELHISQPALHVQVRKLADAIGRPLYHRSGRALALTPEGQQVASFARETRERGNAMLDQVRGEAASSPVVLAAGHGAFVYLLGPAIRRFPKQTWTLRLVTMSAPATIMAVRDSRAHLGVAAIVEPPADLVATPIHRVGQHVVVPASHRLADRRTLRVDQLAGEPLVVAPEGTPHRTMLATLFRAAGAQLAVAVEATGWELVLQFVRYGVGIAIVNEFCSPPKGTVAIPLVGAPAIDYFLFERRGPARRGVDALRALITT
jgi:DNA-binding transcriptional LysR family regulator